MMYKTLKEEIINCVIAPGTKITEEDLVKRFNQSRTPVRSVIARLETEGLLEVKPKRGTFVTKIDLKSIYDAMEIRIATEEKVFFDIIGKFKQEQFDILNKILDEQKDIIKMDSSINKSQLFYETDNRFHRTIFSFANKESVWFYLNEFMTPLNRARIMANLRKNESVEDIYELHLKICEYLKTNKPKRLFKVFEAHLRSGFTGLDDVAKEYPGYFTKEK